MASSGGRVKTTMIEMPTLDGAVGLGAAGNGAATSRNVPKTLIEGVGDDPSVQSWRPLYRPPMSVLWVMDDDGESGEYIRLREERFVIGRDQGDLKLPNDSKVSGQHAEIVRTTKDGEFRWYVNDLESTNGTFVKIDEGIVRHQQELILGSRRYRFEVAPLADKSASGDRNENRKGTQAWQVATVAKPEEFAPTLVELKPEGDGQKYVLDDPLPQLGSDPAKCSVVVEGDPFLNPLHCRFVCRENGDWCVEDLKSKNGTWMRINKVRVRSANMILIGEQRIVVRQM